MGKALLAVGGFLALCMVIFGSVVYFTRTEDRVAVDALLAERIGREVTVADEESTALDLRRLTSFDWDRVYVFPVDTPRARVSEALGFEFKGDLLYTVESSELFVFTNRGKLARFADYRGRHRFEGLDRPVHALSADDALFAVRDGVVTLAR